MGITEYFVFDVRRQRLQGHRLASSADRAFAPIVPQGGAYACHVLGLELAIEAGRLRFSFAGAELPETRELFERANAQLAAALARAERLEQASSALDEAVARADEEARLRAEEARLRAEEARLRAEAEGKLAAALAEIERLKRGG